jgi:hypothetical protein
MIPGRSHLSSEGKALIDDVMEQFARETPAAVLFRGLFARVFSDERMNEIFRAHKRRQRESTIVFSVLMRMLTPVVSGAKKAFNSSFIEHEKTLGASFQAAYDKLQRVEPSVSAAIVRVPTDDLAQIVDEAACGQADLIPGYHAFIIDGKRLDATEHRLQETRRLRSAPLPGTVLALLDTRRHLFVDVACDPDAYVCERKAVEPILNRLQPGALYLTDRNFCDGPLLQKFAAARAYFLVRQHGRSPAWRETPGSKLTHVGQDSRGGVVSEQAVEVLFPDGTWHPVRRIVVQLAKKTRDGETELSLLTNLPKSITASQVSDGYGGRWTIETCLEHLAQALNAEIKTLAYPGAALLCFCLALLLFNIMSTLRSLLAKHGSVKRPARKAARPRTAEPEKPKVSFYYLAAEIAETRRGMEIVVEAHTWRRLAALPLADFIAWAVSIAKHANLYSYRTHTRGDKKPPPKRASGKQRPHVSSHRILANR